MIKYIEKGTALQHLTDRLMESALNNVGIKADADEVFRDIAENRLPVWMAEIADADVAEVVRCRECTNWDKTWTNDFAPDYHYCPMIEGVRKGDFYCADGERRTDG